MHFTPCQGKHSCRETDDRCLTCGRSLEEIYRLRELLDELSSLAVAYDYDNVDEFAAYVARKLPKMVAHRVAGSTGIEPSQEATHAD